MREIFTPAELADGWRLACTARVEGPLTLEIAPVDHAGSHRRDAAAPSNPRRASPSAIDLGTTTLGVQLVDLADRRTWWRCGPASTRKTVHGADVMSRIQFALEGGAGRLASLIREALGNLIAALPPPPSRCAPCCWPAIP